MSWQDKGKRAPFCYLAPDTDLAAKEFGKLFCDRQTEPDSAILSRNHIPVSNIKWDKDGVPGLTSHPGAIVPDSKIMIFSILLI
jgi:hypothetical protein